MDISAISHACVGLSGASMLAEIPYPQINPVLFNLFGYEIRWYGLAYLAGVACGWLLLLGMIKRHMLRMTSKQLSDLITWIIIGVLAGGRIGYMMFYYKPGPDDPWWSFLAIWKGGMAFHGGLVGVALAMIIWSRLSKTPVWNIIDAASVATPIGLLFGRIANFINGELVGRVTDVPWGMRFPDYPDDVRHPSQLYEAVLEGPLLMLCVWLCRYLPGIREGMLGGIFAMGYGFFRFMVEFVREPDPQLGFIAWGWLTMGQALSFVLFIIGAGLVILAYYSSGRKGVLRPASAPLAEQADSDQKPKAEPAKSKKKSRKQK